MICEADLHEIAPGQPSCSATSEHVLGGVPIPKTTRVQTFSAYDWEQFVEEWASSLKFSYVKVRRFGGSGDLGVDIAGFCTENGFNGVWDNHQCKHYDHPLYPSDIWIEIGKIIYYSYIGEYIPPSKHYFVCPQGIGTSLERLLNKPDELKGKTAENWIKYCQSSLTTTKEIELSGELQTILIILIFQSSLPNLLLNL